MLYAFGGWTNPALFHTGWFVESLLTQTMIIHVIRTNGLPFLKSRASHPLTVMTLVVAAIGVWLPYSPLAAPLGFVQLPLAFWGYIAVFLLAYLTLTQVIKQAFIRKFGWD